MIPGDFRAKCLEVVQKHKYSDYCHVPDSFKPLIEATVLHQLLSETFGIADGVDVESTGLYLKEKAGVRDTFLECWQTGQFGRILDLDGIETVIKSGGSHKAHIVIQGGTFKEIHGDNYEITIGEDDQPILNWLGRIDYIPVQRDNYGRRAHDTGVWFLNNPDFGRWISGEEGRILWCPGIPGAGKTVIASTAINHLQKLNGVCVLFVYFDYKRRKDQNTALVLGSLARQMYEHIPRVRDTLKDTFQEHKNEHPTETILLSNLREIIPNQNIKFFVVLDALDEYLDVYSDRALSHLLDLLLGLDNHLKLMVTSRTLGSMETMFKDRDAIRLEIMGAKEDMEIYIRDRVTNEISFAHRILENILSAVIGTSKQRFLPVRLHMDNLCSMLNVGEIRDSLAELSSNIEDAYALVLERINSQTNRRKDLAHRILAWIARSFQHLTARELQEALATARGRIDIDDYIIPGDSITAVCAGLIVIEEGSGIVKFSHMTVHEYLQQNPEKLLYGHQLMARTCIDHIFTLVPQFWCKGGYIEELQNRQFFRYAFERWGSHCRNDEDTLFQEIVSLLSDDEGVSAAIKTVVAGQPFWHLPTRHDISYRDWESEIMDLGTHIHVAAYYCLPRTLSFFLSKGLSINGQTADSLRTPLNLVAAKADDSEPLRLVLSIPGVDVNLQDDEGLTPLAWASRVGATENVMILLQQDSVDIHLQDSKGRTPLVLAAGSTRPERDTLIVEKLLNAGASRGDNSIHTALTSAIRANWEAVVDILIAAGGNPMKSDNTSLIAWSQTEGPSSVLSKIYTLFPDAARLRGTMSQAPLFMTASNGTKNEMEALLDSGLVRPDEKDKDGRSALSHALQRQSPEVANAILASMMQNNTKYKEGKDSNGRTDLSYAVEANFLSIVKALVETGSVDINSTDHNGRIPLSYAMPPTRARNSLSFEQDIEEERTRVEMMKYLIQHDAKVDHADQAGRTPLSYAAERNGVNLVRLLLENGAKIDREDKRNRTPLSYAAERSDVNLVCLLLENGAEIDREDKQNRTPLSYAAQRSDVNLVRLLLENGAGIDREDKQNRTPLSYAAEEDYYNVAQVLLEKGASPTVDEGHGPRLLSSKGRTQSLLTRYSTKRRAQEILKNYTLSSGRS